MTPSHPGLCDASSGILLRAFDHRNDSEALRSFVNDPEAMAGSNAWRPIDSRRQELWMESAVLADNQFWFVVARASEPKVPLGTCCLVGHDPIARNAELRVRIGAERGTGIGRAACTLLIKFGWEHLNLERIWLRVHADNHAAVRLYEKLGFEREGTLRRAAFTAGKWRDVAVYGLIASHSGSGTQE